MNCDPGPDPAALGLLTKNIRVVSQVTDCSGFKMRVYFVSYFINAYHMVGYVVYDNFEYLQSMF